MSKQKTQAEIEKERLQAEVKKKLNGQIVKK